MYIGMCVGHYKSKEEDRISKIKRLAAMGLKYLNSVSVPGDAPQSELRGMKAVIADLGIVPIQCDGGVPQWGTFDPAKGDEVLEAAKPFLDNAAELGNKLTCPLPPQWHEEMPLEVSRGTSIEWTRSTPLCWQSGAWAPRARSSWSGALSPSSLATLSSGSSTWTWTISG